MVEGFSVNYKVTNPFYESDCDYDIVTFSVPRFQVEEKMPVALRLLKKDQITALFVNLDKSEHMELQRITYEEGEGYTVRHYGNYAVGSWDSERTMTRAQLRNAIRSWMKE